MKNITIILYQIVLLLLVLWGLHAWFTWPLDVGNNIIIYGLIDFVAIIYAIKNNISIKLKNKEIMALFLFVITIAFYSNNLFSFIESIIHYFPIIILICDKTYNFKHLEFISKIFGWIVIIGAVPYLLYKFSSLPLLGIPINYEAQQDSSYYFMNYFVFIDNIFGGDEALRYSSVFLEPGYLGTFSAFLLFLNRYDLHKPHNAFILIGLLLSFSLAGYVIGLCGYCLSLLERGLPARRMILLTAAIYSAVTLAPYVNNGDNLFNNLIVERMQVDEEKGIVGNDRFHGDTDRIFEESIKNGAYLWGIDKQTFSRSDIYGAGYKIYILQRGLVSLILILLFYVVLANNACNRRHCLYATIVLVLILIQATTPFSYRWLVPFLLSIGLNDNRDKQTSTSI